MFTQSLLSHLYEYDAEGGRLLYRRKVRNVRQGSVAGYQYNKAVPYRRVSLLGKCFLLHRLIWMYHFGDIPDDMCIDHISGDSTDNRIENLRMVPHVENVRNRRRNRISTNPAFGVQKNPRCNSWAVTIYDKGKPIYVGSFKSEASAIAARKAAERKYGYHENHGNRVAA